MVAPLGERLRDLRELARLAQEGLAYKAGISVGTIRGIEQGIRYPSPETLDKIVETLAIPQALELAEYRLARARRLLDEREVGLEQAISCLDAFDVAQQRLAEEAAELEAQQLAATDQLEQATAGE